MKRYLHICMMAAAVFSAALGLSSCLDIKLDDQYSDPDAVNSTQRAKELLSAAYNSLPRYQIELSLLGDDFCPTSLAGRNSEMQNLYAWQEKAIDDLSSGVWSEYYYTISLVNALLQRIPSIVEDDLTTLHCVEASACALKAMCYFELLKLYAPVWSEANQDKDGIILKDRLELEFLPRSTLKTCVEEVSSLLDRAAALFSGVGEDKLDRV
ncbi:MAG: RagB/SusD family nutrient uptake outer membrane protein, partial [Candidatus Cryptobacteroides sp.]